MTRRLLLATALELFEAKGYAATTVDDIAAAAGTTRVTFYAYFPSRTDLMKALIGELNELLERSEFPDRGSTAKNLVETVREGTRDGIGAWLRDRAKHWDEIRPYTRAAFEAATVDPELRGLMDAWVDEVVTDIDAGLTEGGRFDPGTRHMRGHLAFVQLDHVARLWAQGREPAEVDRMLEVLTDSWTDLLTEAPDRSGR